MFHFSKNGSQNRNNVVWPSLKKVGWMSSDKAWALLQYPLLAGEKSEITAGRSTLFGLYLEDYWELGEVPLLFSILFMLYKKVVQSLSTF